MQIFALIYIIDGHSCWFWVVLTILSIILMILMMTEFTKEILARVKMFYKENEQTSRRVIIMQKFWGEIWYMSTLLPINFDMKIKLIQSLRHPKLDFKRFPTVYYMLNSDNRATNDDRLKFTEIVSQKRQLGFLVLDVNVD